MWFEAFQSVLIRRMKLKTCLSRSETFLVETFLAQVMKNSMDFSEKENSANGGEDCVEFKETGYSDDENVRDSRECTENISELRLIKEK